MPLSVQNVSLSFGERDILKDISFTINEKSRIALVGANGCGKTTLLKIISGAIEANGIISKERNSKILYASQSESELSNLSLKEEAFKIFENFPREEHEKESIFNVVRKGLGFSKEDESKNCAHFSEGFQMRIVLLKVLIAKPTYMLLDEPTNYLDIETRLWLVKYLHSLEGGYILVSHDRYFLDETVDEIFELSGGNLTKYTGGYTDYEIQRVRNLEQLVKKAGEQEKEIKKTEEFIERFRYKATKSKAVQSRIKALEKIERIELPAHLKHIHFSLPTPPFQPNDILSVTDLTKFYGDKCIFNGANFSIRKRDRVAIVGRNGEGKSTLLRLVSKTEGDYTGTIKMADNLSYKFFRGDDSIFKDELNRSTTVLDYALRRGPNDEQKIKNMLGAFMFRDDDIQKSVSVLSGGEKSRLELLTCIMEPSCLLILDEPTNHLDIASKDVLIEALDKWEGTLLFVSHDVHFIESLATKIIHIENKKVSYYDGDWQYFSRRREELSSSLVFDKINLTKDIKQKNDERKEKVASGASLAYEQEKRQRNEEKARAKKIAQLERDIEELTRELKSTEDEMNKEEVYSSVQKSTECTKKIATLKSRLEALEEEWLNLTV